MQGPTPRGTHRPSSTDWDCQSDPHVETLTYSLTSCSPLSPYCPKTNSIKPTARNSQFTRSVSVELLKGCFIFLHNTSRLDKKIVGPLKCERSKIRLRLSDLCSWLPLFNTLGMNEATCADNYSTKYI